MPAKNTTASTRKTTQRKTTTTRKAPVKRAAPKPKPEEKDHIRNLRRVPLRLRFPSQKIKDGDRGFELAPRGNRGDVIRVSEDDRSSTYYSANLGLTFEAITASQAREVIEKQSTNEQAKVHPAMASLRSELGEPYAQENVKLEIPFEDQGKVVGNVELDGRKRVQINRTPGAAPEVVNVPRSQETDPERIRDEIARSKHVEGPKAGLAGITKVTVGEVQRA